MRESTLQRIRQRMDETGIDSFIIGERPNIRYLSGFSGDFCYIVINRKRAVFFTNSLYIEEAGSTVSDSYEIAEVKDGIIKSLKSLDGSFWGKRIGFEEEKIPYSSYVKLKKLLHKHKLVPTAGIVEELREIKNNHEIENVKRAQEISERVFSHVLTLVREGVMELDLAMEIDYRFRQHGGECSAFETIVASGPNTSKPHAVPSKRKIHPGDFVLFDMGTVVDGYSSDMTRTVVLGKADDEQKNVYAVVLDAQNTAIDSIQTGLRCSQPDRTARDVIKKAGYHKRFVHWLGHGVGLEIHENPYLIGRSRRLLQKNALVTIEPGIYIPDWGGVRIEDMVVVKDNGCVNLTGVPKELIEL